jgi:hypothetical protein
MTGEKLFCPSFAHRYLIVEENVLSKPSLSLNNISD